MNVSVSVCANVIMGPVTCVCVYVYGRLMAECGMRALENGRFSTLSIGWKCPRLCVQNTSSNYAN